MTAVAPTTTVPCPTCNAEIGEPCCDLTSDTHMEAFHPRRIDLRLKVQAGMDPVTGFLPDAYTVVCPDCAALPQSLCWHLNNGDARDFPHLNRVLAARGTLPPPPASKVSAQDEHGRSVTVELRVEKGVVVIDVDTNGDADVDMYGETLAVIRRGHAQNF